MNAFGTRYRHTPVGRRVRFDAPAPFRETPDAAYLRGWVTRQARLYDNLLNTIAHAPSASRGVNGR